MSPSYSRFHCPSFPLDLKGLLATARRTLGICLACAVAGHVMVTQVGGPSSARKVPQPLTMQFIKRAPRFTKPLELRKRPRPRRRQMRRERVSVTAQVRRQQASGAIRPLEVLGQLARPSVDMSRAVAFQSTRMEPQAVARAIQGEKEARDRVDMSLEMLDVEALDTGRYHAMVIQDPSDKRNIKGFFRLRYAYSITMAKSDFQDQLDRLVHGTIALTQAMNQYTDINASFEGRIPFTSSEMLKTPWVFCYIAEALLFPHQELSSLGTYLTSGGFMFCDVWSRVRHLEGLGHRRPAIAIRAAHNNFEQAMETQGLTYGRDWTFEMLSNDHPIYHCFFDFEGVPAGPWDDEFTFADRLQGLYLDGRWPVVMCQKGLLHLWSDPRYPEMRNERLIQFGINTIIFALTQEGSITHRLLDSIE